MRGPRFSNISSGEKSKTEKENIGVERIEVEKTGVGKIEAEKGEEGGDITIRLKHYI